MGKNAKSFRERAAECRQLAAITNDEDWRAMLLDLADELEAEADKIATEETDIALQPNPSNRQSRD